MTLTYLDPAKREEVPFKVLIYGGPGAGKTAFGTTSPDPVILLTERQGLSTVQIHNPEARVLFVPTLEDFKEALQAIIVGDIKCGTVVIDSVTDFNKRLQERYTSKSGEIDWRNVQQATASILGTLRDLPHHVVVIALLAEKEDTMPDGGKMLVRRPDLPGKLGGQVAQFFNIVGFLGKVERDGKVTHKVSTKTGDRYVSKHHPALGEVEEPDFSEWIGKIDTFNDERFAPKKKASKKKAPKKNDGELV